MISIKDIKEKDDLLIICPTAYKNKLLESFSNEKILVNTKFMSFSEYKKNYFFDVSVDAYKYLMDKYSLSLNNTKEIISNLIYVEDKKYNVDKLDELVKYKKELEDNNLLIKNSVFLKYLKTKNVLVIGYGRLNVFDLSIIKGKTVEIIEDKEAIKKYIINTFDDIEGEVEFVYNSITDLLIKGVDINKIYILNFNDNYTSYFKRFNTYYGFNIDLGLKKEIIGTSLGQEFILMLNDKTKEEIYEYLVNINDDVAYSLINLLNKYAKYELSEVRKLILDDLKPLSVYKVCKNTVRCVESDYVFNDDEHVFLIGFNDNFPKMKRDVEYITNNLRGLVNMASIEEENALIKLNTRSYLSNINNLTMSYSKTSPFDDFNLQVLFNEEKIEYKQVKMSYEYSDLLNKRKYASMLDDLYKFDIKDDDIEKLYKAYDRNDYLEYDNSFKGLSNQEIDNIKEDINNVSNSSKLDKNKITLSYSSIDNFYKCNYKYYLDSVLGIKDSDSNFAASLGTICHAILQDYFENKKAFNFDTSWFKQLDKFKEKNNKDAFKSNDEIFFSNKIKEELRKDIEIIKKQNENSLLDKCDCENNFTYEVNKDINYTGFVDKVMYKEKDEKMYASVVDYKTSKHISIDRKLMEYGLSLQLPTYLYLLKNAGNYKDKDIEFIGFYIQHLINYDNKYDSDKSLLDKKSESMKLDGISIDELDKVSILDASLSEGEQSSTISKLYVTKSGKLSSRSKNVLYSKEEFNKLIDLVNEKAIFAGNTILNGDFSINPKFIKDKNQSCDYCPYVSVCYRRLKDYVYIKDEEEKEEQ